MFTFFQGYRRIAMRLILRNTSVFSLTAFFALALLCPTRLYAQAPDNPEALKSLVERVDRALSPDPFTSIIIMENHSPNAETTRTETSLYRKGKRLLVIMREPKIQRGQALLRNDDDMWMYLPRSGKLMRIGSKDKSLGGETSNADLMRVDLADDYAPSYLGRETVDGKDCWKLELRALRRTVAFDRVVYWIDSGTELPVLREFYSLSGQKLRSMRFSNTRSFGARSIPATLTIINELNPAYYTVITTKELRADVRIPDSKLTTAWLESGGSLED